ncbi:MAG: hypothetical protein UR66_C0004G0090 [Candidatus Moranbacteria bacterium GW2011_GWE1_35_17]|nr:MAG: hypothetical protein UR66_C0004G0090 [Candidatus Moranbacteria bacterium GW2011_GWE1_35_17]KKP84659.1 MAG: hypothetical protein UR82_C0001G0026 [Candidatus Moranbacteria bacterium GW2011_GWF1_35_5]
MENAKNNRDYNFFIYLSLFGITISWGLFLLALSGIFYWWTVSILIAVIAASGFRFILSNLIKISIQFLIVNIILIATATVFVTFSAPTVFSGRDQGSISQAAIRLAQNGRLEFATPASTDFFNINVTQKNNLKNCLIDKLDDFQDTNSLRSKFYTVYCQAKTSSKAFNFPGFYYTADGNLVTQFPIVYIAWLALFYSFLGILGFQIANGILLYSSLMAFYLLIHRLTNLSQASFKIKFFTQISSLAIIATSFCFMWFSKFTLTENIAIPLLWIGILTLLIITGSNTKSLFRKKSTLLLFFLSLGLLIFTRIEGLVFFLLAILYLIANKNSGRYFRKNFLIIVLPPLVIIGAIFIWNLHTDIYFYKSVLKATLENLSENSSDIAKNNSLLTILNLFKIFGLYGILAPMLFGLAGVFYLVKTKKYNQLIPLFIIFPSFFYILSPQITMEHPWMLRRFTFSILPAFIIYSIILINTAYRKKNILLGIILTLIIVYFNFPSFSQYLTFIPDKNLLKETKKISQNFSDKDLILVDQMSSGNNFEMIDQPLSSIFGKNAVYFFNVADLDKIDKSQYEKIYLIIPETREKYYRETSLKNKMLLAKNYSIEFSALHADKKNFSLPGKEITSTEGLIFELTP